MGFRPLWFGIGMKRELMDVLVVTDMIRMATRRNIVEKDHPFAVVGMTMISKVVVRFDLLK